MKIAEGEYYKKGIENKRVLKELVGELGRKYTEARLGTACFYALDEELNGVNPSVEWCLGKLSKIEEAYFGYLSKRENGINYLLKLLELPSIRILNALYFIRARKADSDKYSQWVLKKV